MWRSTWSSSSCEEEEETRTAAADEGHPQQFRDEQVHPIGGPVAASFDACYHSEKKEHSGKAEKHEGVHPGAIFFAGVVSNVAAATASVAST